MRNLKTMNELFESSINEAKAAVSDKDWSRMVDLVMKGGDGESVAKLIKDKGKAIARFVAGLKLDNSPLNLSDSGRYYYGTVSAIGDRALALGATPDEIQAVYDATDVPQAYIDKMAKLGGKKLDNRFVGVVSKAVLDLGFDIKYLPHNGNALTYTGKDAMQRNGRKWTIGYKSELSIDDKTFDFNFDAITDEGDGPTYYVIDGSSDNIFNNMMNREKLGKLEFLSKLKEILSKLK
jgi:hypothetical protein